MFKKSFFCVVWVGVQEIRLKQNLKEEGIINFGFSVCSLTLAKLLVKNWIMVDVVILLICRQPSYRVIGNSPAVILIIGVLLRAECTFCDVMKF